MSCRQWRDDKRSRDDWLEVDDTRELVSLYANLRLPKQSAEESNNIIKLLLIAPVLNGFTAAENGTISNSLDTVHVCPESDDVMRV